MKRYLFLLIIIFLLGGCSKTALPEEVPNDESITKEDQESVEKLSKEEQQDILKQYYNVLNSPTNYEEIKNFIDSNVERLDTEIVDEMIIGLEDFLRLSSSSFKDISTSLMRYYDYSSDEIKSYLNILNKEGIMIFSDGEVINIDLEELLSRVIAAEDHLKIFPNGKTSKNTYELYQAYIVGAIEGTGNQYIYAKSGGSTIREEVIESYNNVITNNKGGSTSKILAKYLEVLALDNNDMNGENILRFYEDLPRIIEENSRI